jgi:REP element-mobilizing transposase RayT
MGTPLAYLLTWTTYGAWLHGDPRGSVDDQHNVPGEPYAPANAVRQSVAARRMRSTGVVLDADARRIVAQAIADHCAVRRWELIAMHVRTRHVHAIIGAPDTRPELVAGQLKSWATRRLRDAGQFGPDDRIWTREASTRYLWEAESVRRAGIYVVEQQGDEL